MRIPVNVNGGASMVKETTGTSVSACDFTDANILSFFFPNPSGEFDIFFSFYLVAGSVAKASLPSFLSSFPYSSPFPSGSPLYSRSYIAPKMCSLTVPSVVR